MAGGNSKLYSKHSRTMSTMVFIFSEKGSYSKNRNSPIKRFIIFYSVFVFFRLCTSISPPKRTTASNHCKKDVISYS